MNSQSNEDEVWADALSRLGVEGAQLISQSRFERRRRVYRAGSEVYKISLGGSLSSRRMIRQQTLAGEAAILASCAHVKGIPRLCRHVNDGEIDVLVTQWIDGVSMQTSSMGFRRALTALSRLARILVQLSLAGISHNDVLPSNILIAEAGVYLIDFDQARVVSVPRAFWGNFIGKSTKSMDSFGSFTHTLIRLARRTPMFREYRKIAQLDLPALPPDASPMLRSLAAAWLIGQISNANAPGATLCYYSLDCDGYHFPGERPWLERWNMLKNIAPYQGKRILELGCNLGLLSSYLLTEAAASAVLAVDGDVEILAGAQCVASAFCVAPRFVQCDFDAPQEWERELLAFKPDIVFALSVLNWVQDKERFMRFLGHFDEVIFEGHDAETQEHARFRSVGFEDVRTVAVSERNRPIIHARK